MKTWCHAMVLASLLLGQLAVPGTVHSSPALQETATETASSTPPATSTAGELTPTATETAALASQTPAPQATETPTLLPEGSPTPTATEAPVSLSLSVTPEFSTPGGRGVIHWEITGLTPDPATDRLLFTLPEGMQPSAGEEGQYDADSHTYSLVVEDTKGQLSVDAASIESGWISASLLRGEESLAEASAEFLALEQFTVQASGGTISARGGRLKISFPSGALDEPAQVQVGRPSRERLPGGSLSGEPFELRAFGVQSGRELSQFAEEIAIELDYSSQEVLEDYEERLSLYWYNDGSGDWEALPGWVDQGSKTLRARTTHFTVFDTGVNQWEAARTPSVESFQVADFTGAGTFSLPIEVPPGPGGLQPGLTLSYNSQVVDQATVNTQASWVGMGWSLETGSITREANDTERDEDDNFFLNVAGTSTRIVRDGSGAYHAASENFWRFSRDTTNDTWTVWDKVGNVYFFEHAAKLAYAMPCDNDPAEELYGGAGYLTYRWSLTRVWNAFSNAGQQLTYTYVTETKEIQAARYIHYNDRGCVANTYPTDTAVYPQTIVYPNGRYRVYFETEARTDYTASWTWDAVHHDFMRSRLKNIYIQDRGDAAAFVDPVSDISQTVRRYAFLYDGGSIFPSFTYSAGGKVSTLASVQEFAPDKQSNPITEIGLPAHTFTYGDKLHLTRAANGYGGQVVYGYDGTAWAYGDTVSDYKRIVKHCPDSPWTVRSGTLGTKCEDPYNDLRLHGTIVGPAILTAGSRLPMVRPGGMYSISFEIQSLAPGMTVKVGAFNGLDDSGLGYGYDQTGTHTYVFTLSENANSLQPLIETEGGGALDKAIITSFRISLLPGFHRVTSKTVLDGQGHEYITTYGYEDAAVNTSANSDVCAPNEADCKSVVEANSEFRGHNIVTVTGPDGRQAITTYAQTDADAGQPSGSKVKSASGAVLSETMYNWSSTDLGLYGLPGSYTRSGFVHNWLRPSTTISYTYGSSTTATQVSDTYEAMYGNLTARSEQWWNGGAWVTYRTSTYEYNTPLNTSSKYLVGLPVRSSVRQGGPDGAPLAESISLYDGNNGAYTLQPSAGVLTATRTWMDSTRYSQASYGYDAWGNGTSATQYTGYGTASTPPTSGAQTSYTCYGSGGTLGGTDCDDDGYHTYPLWSQNALRQKTDVTYDYSLSVPKDELDPNHALTTATYDIFGRITSITRPEDDGTTLTMSYEDTSPFTTTLTQQVDENTSYSLVRKYDGMGRNFETTAGGIVSTTSYDGYGRVVWQSVPGGTEGTSTSYDALGRPLSVISPDGTGVSYGYNGLTTTLTEPDANGGTHNTVTTTDVWGRVISVAPPTGPGVTYSYDIMDRMVTAVRGGLTTSLTYDQAGRKLAMSDPDMGDWSYSYDALGNLTTQTDARGCLLSMSYDALNRLAGKVSSGAGCGTQVTTGYSYDAGTNGIGRRTGMTDASGSTSWEYDLRGRITKEIKAITGSGPFETRWEYNSADLVKSMIYPGEEEVTYQYNSQMLMESLSYFDNNQAKSYVSSTSYDAAGRVTARTLGNGLVQQYAYYPWNTQGGRLQVLAAGSGAWDPNTLTFASSLQRLDYQYDPAGNITQIGDAPGAETQEYGYDALNRLVSWKVNGHISGLYGYGGVSGMLENKGTTDLQYGDTTHPHAVTGAVLQEGGGEPSGNPGTTGLAAWWNLDEASGTRADSHSIHDMEDHNTVGAGAGKWGNAADFEKDNLEYLGSPSSTGLQMGASDIYVGAWIKAEDTMSGNPNVIAKLGTNREFNLRVLPSGQVQFIVYSKDGTGYTNVSSTNAIAYGQWAYVEGWTDKANRTVYVNINNGTPGSASWGTGENRDAAGSSTLLIGARVWNGTVGEYWDGLVDEVAYYKRMLSAAERTWLYNGGQGRGYLDLDAPDFAGCPQGAVCDYDQAQTGVDNSYGYDANGNQVTRTIGTDVLSLLYDAENRLVRADKNGALLASFVYDGDGKRVQSTINGVTTYFVGNYYEQTGTAITKYYYAGSQRAAMRVGSTVYYLLSDHLGSTSLTLNASGNVISELRYTAWGSVRYQAGVTPTEYTYTGQYSDSSINLLDYGSRRFDPELGRFIQPDPIVPASVQGVQAYDRYAYVSNNPVRYNDPTGHCPMCIGAVVGGLVNAGLYIYTESRQPGGFDLQSDWQDLAVAAGTGAVAGALIGSGVGASAGAAMLASAAGVGMAGNIISDHAENVLEGEDFSWQEHVITGLAGTGQGLVAGQLITVTGAVGVGAQLLNAGVWGGLGETVQSEIDGNATLEDFKDGFVSNAVSQAFNLGINKMVSWDADAGVWIDPPGGSRELIDVITPAFSTFGNWAVREEQRRWRHGYDEE